MRKPKSYYSVLTFLLEYSRLTDCERQAYWKEVRNEGTKVPKGTGRPD